MPKTPIDPIIYEVRAVREAHAARFNYDMAAIFQDIRAMQEKSGREYVRYPARHVVASDVKHKLSGEGVDPPPINSK